MKFEENLSQDRICENIFLLCYLYVSNTSLKYNLKCILPLALMQDFFIICPFSVITPFVPVLLNDLPLPKETHSHTPVSLHMVFPLFFYIIHLYPNLGSLPNLYCWTRDAQAGFWEFFLFKNLLLLLFTESSVVHTQPVWWPALWPYLFQLGDESHWLCPKTLPPPLMVDLIISVIVIGPDGFHQLSQGTLVSSWLVWRPQCCRSSCGPGVPAGPSPWWCSREPPSFSTGRPCHEQLPLAEHSCSPPRWWQCWPCSKDRWPLGGQFAGSFLLLLGQQPLLCLLLHLWTVLVGQLK